MASGLSPETFPFVYFYHYLEIKHFIYYATLRLKTCLFQENHSWEVMIGCIFCNRVDVRCIPWKYRNFI